MILITGGAGYIGSHTVLNFLKDNYEILIFDNLETGHIETVEELKKHGNVLFKKGDLRNINDLETLFTDNKIDSVIHFAAFSLVEESIKNPQKYYFNNVLGTLNLLDTMIKHDVKHIVFSSTCATFGEPEYVPIDEKHPQLPINPYGKTKLMIEKILEDYDNAYGLKSIKLRYFNVAGCDSKNRIGEWHNPETHLIPNILKSVFDKTKKFQIFGDNYKTIDGTCIRDYINVEDLADAHKAAYLYLLKENISDDFNLGTEKGASVKEIFDICEKVLNTKIQVEIAPKRAGDPAILYANSQKAKNILGWNSKKTLENSIQSAFKWEQKLQEKF